MKLRQPLIGAERKCMEQQKRAAAARFKIANRAMQQMRNLGFHAVDCGIISAMILRRLTLALIVIAMMGALSGLGGGVGGMWTNLQTTAQTSM